MTDKKQFYKTDDKNFLNWKPCLKCGAEIIQERKAFFVCINCKQEYIADEEDIRI